MGLQSSVHLSGFRRDVIQVMAALEEGAGGTEAKAWKRLRYLALSYSPNDVISRTRPSAECACVVRNELHRAK